MARALTAAEPGPYARMVDEVREVSLTTAELAAVTGVRPRQVQHWASGSHCPRGGSKERLLEVHYVVERLREVYTLEGVDVWIHGRNRGLAGERPLDLMRAGRFDAVRAAVERLVSGAM